jgi:Mrp family chromosome partitioning ATPase/uncharacterized protein involved in exopolysaccharide biosynthesis
MAAPGSTSATKPPPPDLFVLIECVWRHKWKALAAACLLAALFGTLAHLAIRTRFKATVLIRLAAPSGIVERPNETSAAQREFRNTQGELLRMPHVLKRALGTSAVKDLGVLKSDSDGVETLTSMLSIELPKTTEIMRISIEHERADVAFLLVNAVAEAYLNEVRRDTEEEFEKKIVALDTLQSGTEERLAKSWDELQALAKELGAGDPASASLQAQAEIENYRDFARRLRDLQAEKREAEREIRTIKSSPEGLTKEMPEESSMQSVRYAMFQAKLKRERALSKWGPNHPEVRAAEMEEKALAAYYQKTGEEAAAPKRSRQEELLAEPLAKVSRLTAEEAALETSMREIEKRRETLGGDSVARLEIVRNGIKRVEQLCDRLWQTRETLEVERHADKRVQLVSYATMPQARDNSKQKKLTMMAAAGGFGFAMVAIGILEFLTGRLHSKRDFARRTEVEVLGYLPRLPAKIPRDEAICDAVERNLLMELDMLAGALTNHPRIPDARVFMVTSATDHREREGVALHVAGALARMGKKTVLVDLDLRGQYKAAIFEHESAVGISELLSGGPVKPPVDLENALLSHESSTVSNRSLIAAPCTTPENRRLTESRAYQEISLDGLDLNTDIENLDYIPTGRAVAKTLPLLTDLRLRELVDELKRDYTYVVLDVAAAARFPDAVHLAWMVDVAILSAERNISRANRVLEAQARLNSSGLPIFGLMIG